MHSIFFREKEILCLKGEVHHLFKTDSPPKKRTQVRHLQIKKFDIKKPVHFSLSLSLSHTHALSSLSLSLSQTHTHTLTLSPSQNRRRRSEGG